VPLAVPLLVHLDRSARWTRIALPALAAGSLISMLGDYQPGMAERYVKPTPLADSVWRHWPAATNPLPEVFAERTAGFEGPGVLPTATAQCEKALLVGDGTAEGAWPLWCRPTEVAKPCSVTGRYCYANTSANGLAFVVAPRQPAFDGKSPRAWAWSGSPSKATIRLLADLPWASLRFADPRTTEALFVARKGLGRVAARINPEILLVWIDRPQDGASVTLASGKGRRAILIDPQRGAVLQDVAMKPPDSTRVSIPLISPLLLVVVPAALVPPDLTIG